MNADLPMPPAGQEFFESALDVVREYLSSTRERNSKVIEFLQPHELQAVLDLSLGEEGVSDQEVLEICKSALRYSVHTAHPRMFNTLFSGIDMYGLSGVLLTSAANTNVYTFEMAPIFTLMEKEVLSKMMELVGWSNGTGIFAPGGSISNLYGLLAARYHRFPETKAKGCRHLPQFTVFTSNQAHYSVEKAAILMGLGTDYIVKVDCDSMGRMDPDKLERAIEDSVEREQMPIAVLATAGTTVMAAFDQVDRIADICERRNLWLHVDGSNGGSSLTSQKYKHLCNGIERADSVTWNPHKALNAPMVCSTFLTQHQDILKDMLSLHASYLFQKDKVLYNVSWDTGDRSLQCSRANDAFKIWLMFKRNGMAWAGRMIERQVALADYLRERIKERDGFQLVNEEQHYSNVCFWYIPPCLRGLENDADWKQRLHKVAPILKAGMVKAGSMMITYQPLEDHPNFFRMVTVSPSANEKDMDFVLNELERIGAGIVV